MKWLYALIGVIVLAAGGYFLLSMHHKKQSLTQEAVEIISAISDRWSIQVFKSVTDPGLVAAMSSQGQSAEQLLQIYSALGKLKEPPQCVEHNTGDFMKGGERHYTVSFNCEAEYDKGKAVISLTLSNSDSKPDWLVYYIKLGSEVFGDMTGTHSGQ